jgi:TonB family protein
MKTRISLVVCAVLLAVGGVQPQSVSPQNLYKNWKLYTPNGEKLSVALPVYPSMRTLKEKLLDAAKDRRRLILGASNNDVDYTIYVVENPEPRQALESFLKEQITLNPTLDPNSAKDLTLDGITGKSVVYSDGKGMAHVFATQDRLYVFRAYGADLDDPRITTFFALLSLKKQDKTIEVFDGPGSFYETNPLDLYRAPDLDSKVEIQSKPDPSYTAEAENERIKGTVVLRCVFTSKGTVTNFIVVQGLPGGLTEKAIEAARKIRFTPAMKDGRPVSMWMQLEYHFRF